MKTIISVQEISEFEIKPHGDVAQWRALVEAEIAQRWADRSGWIRVDCPACTQKDAIPAFERYGIAYVECSACGSLYAPFRPSEDELWAWYREATPARFWREQILPASEAARREKMTRPRVDWVLDGIAEYIPSARCLVDISPYGRGLVDLVAAENTGLIKVVAAGVTADIEGISSTRVQVQPTRVADLSGHGPADVIVAVDVLDRAADLLALVKAFKNLLAPGGVVFATAPVASGFEIQTLWERSPTIIPPDKLNLLTVEGLQQLFAAPNWKLLELSTPGMFDVEMVRRAIDAEPDAPWPRAVRALVERTDAAGRTALVELLQSRRLTSFARLVARKES
jgi:SAM-dependent methyltransferase